MMWFAAYLLTTLLVNIIMRLDGHDPNPSAYLAGMLIVSTTYILYAIDDLKKRIAPRPADAAAPTTEVES